MSEAVKQELSRLRELGFYPFLHGSRSKLSSVTIPEMEDWFTPPYPSVEVENAADWDYAIQSNEKAQDYFHGLDSGYTSKDDLWYQDCNTLYVFEKILTDGSKIQVSLRNNVETFRLVWNQIDESFYYNYLWKRGPGKPTGEFISAYLDTMFRLVDTLKGKDILWD